jgi:glycosyltransferase involved in cell wall biosynthesis
VRIALLAHSLRVAGGVSVGRNLISSLVAVASEYEYLITVPAGVGYPDFAGQPNVIVLSVPPLNVPRRLWFENRTLPRLLRQFGPDIVLSLAGFPAKIQGALQAVLVQDAHLTYPCNAFPMETWQSRPKIAMLRRRLRRAIQAGTIVFCQTEVMAKRLAQTYGCREPVPLLPNAVSQFASSVESPDAPEQLAPFADRLKLFVLCRYYRYKNLEAIVETYRRYRTELRDTVCLLTIEASQHPRAARLLRSIRDAELNEQIVNLGPIPHEQLAGYYRACDGLLLPTLLESFTGTYLEALLFGRPILTSDLDFAHGICGDAAGYFDPRDPAGMRDAILRLRDEPQWAADLVAQGQRRLQGHFPTWPEIARNVNRTLVELVHNRPIGKKVCAIGSARLDGRDVRG